MLIAYLGVLTLAIPSHEPWSDEAQAWLIARDNSLWQILRYRLHYEGAPGLWHILLHVFQRLHGGYGGFNWFAASFAVLGIVVLLRWSPFPLLIRSLLPFTFFLQYQYAVIARSYVLFPVLAFAICALFRRGRHPVWFGVVAGLLANVSAHGAIFSSTMMLLYILDQLKGRRTAGPSKERASLRLLGPCVAAYSVLFGAAMIVAVPAPDQVDARSAPVVHPGPLHDLLVRFPGRSPSGNPAIALIPPEPAPELDPIPSEPKLLASPLRWAAWYIHRGEADAVQEPGKKKPLKALVSLIVGGAAEATWPVSTSKVFACLFLVVLVTWLHSYRYLRAMLPWTFMIFFGERVWVADHHVGLLFIALLSAIWIAYERAVPQRASPALDRSLILLLAVISACQVTWSFVSIRADRRGSYDPGRATATYLMAHPSRNVVGFGFYTVAIQPYFAHSPFSNIRSSYWIWGVGDNIDKLHQSTIESHPDLVVLTLDRPDVGVMHNEWSPLFPIMTNSERLDLHRDPVASDLRLHGYRETRRFCGKRFSRLSSSYESCDVIFQPAAP